MEFGREPRAGVELTVLNGIQGTSGWMKVRFFVDLMKDFG